MIHRDGLVGTSSDREKRMDLKTAHFVANEWTRNCRVYILFIQAVTTPIIRRQTLGRVVYDLTKISLV
jgi:hypothetical protein